MSKFIVRKSKPLKGTVKVNGAKNSVEPILAASLLAEGQSVIEDVPHLNDVNVMCELIEALGAKADFIHNESKIIVDSNIIIDTTAPYELVSKIRASFLVMGPLLARMGRARVALPGGCPIGARPVDLHLKGFTALGAEIVQGHGYIEAIVKSKLKGNKIYLDLDRKSVV